MNHWWANQSRNFEREFLDGVIWAVDSDHHARKRILDIVPDDVIFSYSDNKIMATSVALSAPNPDVRKSSEGKDQRGNLVRVSYRRFDVPIDLGPIKPSLLGLIGSRKYSPFDKNGKHNEGYLYPLELGEVLFLKEEIQKHLERR